MPEIDPAVRHGARLVPLEWRCIGRKPLELSRVGTLQHGAQILRGLPALELHRLAGLGVLEPRPDTPEHSCQAGSPPDAIAAHQSSSSSSSGWTSGQARRMARRYSATPP